MLRPPTKVLRQVILPAATALQYSSVERFEPAKHIREEVKKNAYTRKFRAARGEFGSDSQSRARKQAVTAPP